MELTRRGFLAGAGALAAAVTTDRRLDKVVLVREAPRQPVKLEGHKEWALVRPHVLGHLSLEEMATGLPGPWQEFLASWWVEGPKVHMPIINLRPWPRGSVTNTEHEDFYGARLNSGYLMHLTEACWKPFIDKWNKEVAVPLYGQEIHTKCLGVAVLTNIHLFHLASKYREERKEGLGILIRC